MLCLFLLGGVASTACAQTAPSWDGMAADRVALTQQTMLLSMRLYLESELQIEGLDVAWESAPKAMRKELEALVDDVMSLQGQRGLPGFSGFSSTVLALMEDVEELDERDLVRGGGRMDRPIEERFYVLVQARLSELELQLALELGVFQRSGLWERIVAAAGWAVPLDPGTGGVMEALSVPSSRATREVLQAEDRAAFPSAEIAAPSWIAELAALIQAGNPQPKSGLLPASQVPALVAMNLPDRFDVPFASGSAVLDLNARLQLAEVRDLMVRYPQLRVVCTGHADAYGDRRTNEELSKIRAEAVRAKILECGVSEERVLMNYFGEDRAGWEPERDRRVEVAFYWEE